MNPMSKAHFAARTIDDLMREVVEALRSRGEEIFPTKGPALELTGVLLELADPRARLSRTESRGKLFSCLGEFCWYLARTRSRDFISYYIPEYKKYAEDGEIFGAYGPRLFDWNGLNQLETVVSLLRRKPASRQAVIQIFDAHDIVEEHKDVPCTCTLQFMLRHEKLQMFTNMRSNDVIWGLPHDIFCFTMLQEMAAKSLSVEPGTYKHAVGSLHVYREKLADAERFLNEGWQSTEASMPPMPTGDPWPAVGLFLRAEIEIRTAGKLESLSLQSVDPYWADLIRLLQIFRYRKDRDANKIEEVRRSMSSEVYMAFIENVLSELP